MDETTLESSGDLESQGRNVNRSPLCCTDSCDTNNNIFLLQKSKKPEDGQLDLRLFLQLISSIANHTEAIASNN
jgi:hypothetical protein